MYFYYTECNADEVIQQGVGFILTKILYNTVQVTNISKKASFRLVLGKFIEVNGKRDMVSLSFMACQPLGLFIVKFCMGHLVSIQLINSNSQPDYSC